jgi:hypothetical protein
MISEGKTFLVISGKHGSYGIANTLQQAVQNCKREGGVQRPGTTKVDVQVVVFTCERSEVTIRADVCLGWECPKDNQVMKFEAQL